MRPPRRSTLIISPFLVHSYAWPNYGNSGASISSGANWSNATAPLIVSNGSRQCEGPTCSGLCCLADATCKFAFSSVKERGLTSYGKAVAPELLAAPLAPSVLRTNVAIQTAKRLVEVVVYLSKETVVRPVVSI
jgi:hypothetical protein